jgi:hypothetical protein
MDTVLGNAVRRRSHLRAQLREIERFIELYQELRKPTPSEQAELALADDSGTTQEHDKTASGEDGASTEVRVPDEDEEAGGLSRVELLPHIRAVIEDAGKPLTRGQLLMKLDSRGAKVGGKANRSKNMGTIMWRLRDDFVNLQGLGYWLRDRPYAPADYDPSDGNSPEAMDYVLREEEPSEPD